MLEFGADKNGKTQKGDTPLICAARNGHVECLEHLLSLGVDVNEKGHRGWTALHWASLNGRYEIAEILVAFGAKIDDLTNDGFSCIYLGTLSGHGALVQDLIKYGANPFTVDNKGDTPLHAAARQNGSALKPLLQAGAAYQRNHAGESPIDVALVRGHRKFIDRLLLGRPDLRVNFHAECLALAAQQCHDTRAFENIFKVLAELCTLDFSHFPAAITQLVDKLGLVSKAVFASTSFDASRSSSAVQKIFMPLPLLTETSNSSSESTPSTEKPSTPNETTTTLNSSTSSFDEPPTSMPESSSPVAIKIDAPSQEPAISVFKHLANALVNFSQEVLRSPKLQLLLARSDLPKQINAMFQPLDHVWKDLETNILAIMDEYKSHKDDESAAREKALQRLSEMPLMIDRYYSISRMLMLSQAAWNTTNISPFEQSGEGIKFIGFVDRIYDALRLLLDGNSNLLAGHLHFVLDMPSAVVMESNKTFADLVQKLSFEQKRNWLRIKIESEQSSAKTGSKIETNRLSKSLLLDCADIVNFETPENLRGKLFIKFIGELGVGAGVQREWFQFIIQHLLDERTGLFEYSSNRVSFSPLSDAKLAKSTQWTFEERDKLYTLLGRVLAMAVVHEESLSTSFSRPVYKSLLGRSSDLSDMKTYDETVYTSLKWLLENEGVSDLGLTFGVVPRGTSEAVSLIESSSEGVSREVDDQSKVEYVDKLVQYYMKRESSEALTAIAKGFHDIVPRRYIAPLNEAELEELLAGQTTIDIKDWRENTEYTGDLTAQSELVQWFWEWVESASNEKRRQMLQFVTGSNTVPLGGFKYLRGVDTRVKFNISKAPKDNGALPTASTCFNMLKLPSFDSKEQFQSRLELSISEGRLGFSFN